MTSLTVEANNIRNIRPYDYTIGFKIAKTKVEIIACLIFIVFFVDLELCIEFNAVTYKSLRWQYLLPLTVTVRHMYAATAVSVPRGSSKG
jgi:hypothetical protein